MEGLQDDLAAFDLLGLGLDVSIFGKASVAEAPTHPFDEILAQLLSKWL